MANLNDQQFDFETDTFREEGMAAMREGRMRSFSSRAWARFENATLSRHQGEMSRNTWRRELIQALRQGVDLNKGREGVGDDIAYPPWINSCARPSFVKETPHSARVAGDMAFDFLLAGANATCEISWRGCKRSALERAIELDEPEIVRSIAAMGVDMDWADSLGRCVIHLACAYGASSEMFLTLIHLGASLGQKNANGVSGMDAIERWHSAGGVVAADRRELELALELGRAPNAPLFENARSPKRSVL